MENEYIRAISCMFNSTVTIFRMTGIVEKARNVFYSASNVYLTRESTEIIVRRGKSCSLKRVSEVEAEVMKERANTRISEFTLERRKRAAAGLTGLCYSQPAC